MRVLSIALLCATACQPASVDPTPSVDPSASVVTMPAATIIDLSHSYDEDTVYWPTAPDFTLTTDFEGFTEAGYYYTANTFCTAEHGGTHIDAPIHFAEGRRSVDQIPLEQLMGGAVVIDVSDQCAENADFMVGVDDFEDWEDEHGPLPDGAIVLLHTGFARFWPDRVLYMGTDERGPEAVPNLHFPGLDPEAAEWLVTRRSINAIGLDTPSIDFGQSDDFRSHQILFEANIPAFENLTGLHKLPPTGFVIIALPMKITGGSGGPLRIIALVPET